jgi:hypothetical protein
MPDKLTNLMKHGFYMMPNVVYKNYGLSPFEMAVYAGIVYHADHETGHAFPGIKLLAEETGMCENKVNQSISRLEELKLIYVKRDTKPEKGEHRRQGNNHYYLLDPKEFPEGAVPESGGSTSPHEVSHLTTCGTPPHAMRSNNTQEQESIEQLTADLEGVPSAATVASPDSVIPKKDKRPAPPHAAIKISQLAPAPEPEAMSYVGDGVLKHPMAVLYMKTFNVYSLTPKEERLLTEKFDDAGFKSRSAGSQCLLYYWDNATGFDEFVKQRLAEWKNAGYPADNALKNLRKFDKSDGNWLGWNAWKVKHSAVTTLRKDEPTPVSDYQAPDEGPKFWEVEEEGVTE